MAMGYEHCLIVTADSLSGSQDAGLGSENNDDHENNTNHDKKKSSRNKNNSENESNRIRAFANVVRSCALENFNWGWRYRLGTRWSHIAHRTTVLDASNVPQNDM